MRKSTETVTHRGQGKPPKGIAQFIELVNAEGLYQRELPDVYKAWYAATDDPESASVSPHDLWVKACAKIAAAFCPATRAFLGPPAKLQSFLDRYEQLKSAREVLVGMARWHRLQSPAHPSKPMDHLVIHDDQLSVDVPHSVGVNLRINEKGVLVLAASGNTLLDALVGVRADRIRSCAICGRIFWARRVNSECCSERCRKTYNQRNTRQARRAREARRKTSKKGR